jgi:hypothetical protein
MRLKTLATLTLLLATCEFAIATTIPLPRPRPGLAPAAAVNSESTEPSAPSLCRQRLTADLAIAPSLPPVVGAGECAVEDVVRLEAVVLADKSRVALTPPATVRCSFAEAIVYWVREDVVPAVRSLDAVLGSIENYVSYECRGRNGVVGAKLSEHGKANALDVASVKLGSGTVLGLTDLRVAKNFREGLRHATCARFSTVLGPGSDGQHENHIHVDMIERRNGYRICQWDVRDLSDDSACARAVPASSSYQRSRRITPEIGLRTRGEVRFTLSIGDFAGRVGLKISIRRRASARWLA